MNDASFLSFRTVRGLICAIMIVVGSVGPWMTTGGASGETVLGVQRGIGQITLTGGAIVAAAVLVGLRHPALRGRTAPALALAFGVLLAIGGLGWWDANHRDAFPAGATRPSNGTFDLQAGWGVQLVAISAAIGLLLMAIEMVQLRRETAMVVEQTLTP